MAKGQRQTLKERLEKVQKSRNDRRARYEKSDATDAALERELQEKIVRERVIADYETELAAKIEEELAKLDNGDATASTDNTTLASEHQTA